MGPQPEVAAVRRAVRVALADLGPGDLVLVACSGGADSVALAAALAFEAASPRGAGVRAGGLTVDHRLQAGSGGMYDPANMPLLHHIHQGLRAHTLFKLDVDYMIKDGGVVIVDEFTGRLMPGRRWSDGLHQAVEAKEGVKIERENQTLATITFQNYSASTRSSPA